MMLRIENLSVTPLSMIRADGLQRVDLRCRISASAHALLTVTAGERLLTCDIALSAGDNGISLFLPPPEADIHSVWKLESDGAEARTELLWKKPREWTFYVMISSHTDIGLHNSQYIQRYNSSRFIDQAAALCDATEDRPESERYRYTVEGSWFWNNYPDDQGADAARRIVESYIKPGKIGVGGGIAGNHTHTFGFEEICRSTYGRSRMKDEWEIDTHTMCMIDNNGMSWSLVQPYCDAGFENIIFAPNQWNPLPSTVWACDRTIEGYTWNPNAGGGGSRVDVRYASALPMLFFWESPEGGDRLLVWCSSQYGQGGWPFGFYPSCKMDEITMGRMESRFAEKLEQMEARYPYDLWLLACYDDDQEPSCDLCNLFADWNKKWKYPIIRTLGNPDAPFREVRERFGDRIPVLRGEMTGGWYQHPLAAANLLSDKLEADRRLANAQTFASLAALHTDYSYPAQDFDRAWQYLLWNDEHSYGTSGYQGRRVYETWMQHRDWIEKAAGTAKAETDASLAALAAKIPGEGLAVFNPTGRCRTERIRFNGQEAVLHDIPPCGYKTAALSALSWSEPVISETDQPPVIENAHYRIAFAPDGSMYSIYDKALGRELLARGGYGANAFVFTEDNHKSFVTPGEAHFTVRRTKDVITVTAVSEEPLSGAAISQTVTLDAEFPRILIDNRLSHVRAMINNHRYYRYLYYAFPFDVEGGRRICQLNGCEAEYAKDLTGHGTDTYMAAHEWCSVENDRFGVGLIQLDSQLIEFDHIHPDKTDCGAAGEGSAIYSYVANDWLQMHEIGGSHVDYRLRYAITSWAAGENRIAETAELLANPVQVRPLSGGVGLPADSHSFAAVPNGQRLISLKRAEDGEGLIARLLGERSEAAVDIEGAPVHPNTVDERPSIKRYGHGFSTLRADVGAVKKREDIPDRVDENCPAPIGSVWTGLITEPRAARGENDGHLYLIWGQNQEKNLSHYELYRSEESGFVPSEENLLAKVEPGVYRVGLYVDEGLKTHTAYFYRVCAVNTDGVRGEMSREFSGITKEPVNG